MSIQTNISPLLTTYTAPAVVLWLAAVYVQITTAPVDNPPVVKLLYPTREPLLNATLRILCVLMALAAGGCASVFRSPAPNELRVTSEPDSAQVIIDGWVYTTPAVITLPPAKRYILEYRKTGYRPVRDTVETSIGTGWLISDIACSLPAFGVPIAVDALFGQWYTIDEEDMQQHIELVPDPAGTQLPFPTEENDIGKSPSRPAVFRRNSEHPEHLAFLLEMGFAYPAYQVPVVPTSYSAGFSYTPAQWCAISLRQEAHGTAADLVLSDTANTPTPTNTSMFILATATDVRFLLWNTGIYLAGGAGVMNTSISHNQSTIAMGWLPFASAGGGYVFSGGTWFIDARYTSALTTMPATSSIPEYRPHYTTVRFGLRLLFPEK